MGKGGGVVHPDPEIGGWPQKHSFSALRASKDKVGGLNPLGPSPGYPLAKQIYYCFGLHRFLNSGKMKLLGFTFCQRKCHVKGKMVRTIATRRSII